MAIFSSLGAWITIGLGNLGLSLTAAMAIGGAVTNLAIGAALLGVQALVGGAIGPRPSATSTPQAQATVNQSTGPRIRGYGRAKLGGTRAFFDSLNGVLFQVVMAHHGKIAAFEQFYVGDLEVALDGSGNVMSPPFAGFVRISAHDGDEGQVADTDMLSNWAGVWTAEHRLRGIAYWTVQFYSPTAERFQAIFPESYNTAVRCVCRLSEVYDPRTGITAWSDNASLCILDYLTHPDGYNRSIDDIELDSFAAFADICGQPIALAAGGTEPRYRIWGIYGLSDDPNDVLGKMRAACDAELYQTPEGKIAIRGGIWELPSVTIRAEDVLAHSMEEGSNRFAAFNELKLIYTSAAHDYQPMEAEAWSDLADQAERGVLQSSISLDMVPSASQARRLAKIHRAKSNPRWKGTVLANLSALDALGERIVRLVLPELGIDDAFFVAGFSILPDLTGVELTVMTISEEAYSWQTSEEGAAAPTSEDTRPDLTLPIPDFSLSQEDQVVMATAADPGRSDLELQAQIRAGVGSLWQEMTVEDYEAEFGPIVTSGPTLYQVRARWRAPLGVAGGWSNSEDIIVS